ncbi:MAG: hypothetical protein WC521_01935 [Bdellovibrionales bacterium]
MSNNNFTIDYLRDFLGKARSNGYRFLTLKDYVAEGCPTDKVFVLRLDLDIKPQTIKPFLVVSREMNIPMTVFIRVAGPYNIFWYPTYACLKQINAAKSEIGFHTAMVEWAKINNEDTESVFAHELAALRSLFPVAGIAPHRDINYVQNSLPWINENWSHLKQKYNIEYHAYEDRILKNTLYVNEGLSPHLGWRQMTPHEAIATGKPIYMLLHPHWWFQDNPFEAD